jgi:hypothetical protein
VYPLWFWLESLLHMDGLVPTGLLLAFALAYAWRPFTSFVHEMGHAAIALLDGEGPVTVVVGGGGGRRRSRGRLTLDLSLSRGTSVCVAPDRTWRGTVIGTFVGPITSLGLAALLYGSAVLAAGAPALLLVLMGGAVMAFVEFSVNLLPAGSDGDDMSDGMRLIFLFAYRREVEAVLAAKREGRFP